MKDIGRCKSRLAEVFPLALRQVLTLAMLENVLLVLGSAGAIRDVIVVGSGARLRSFAIARGAIWMPEGGYGLNATLRDALQRVLSARPRAVGIVLGDLPFLQREEVEEALLVFETGHYDCLLIPDEVGVGTNAVFIRASCSFRPCFGGQSYRRHREDLAKRGYCVGTFHAPGFAGDIDTPRDAFAAWPLLSDYLKVAEDVKTQRKS